MNAAGSMAMMVSGRAISGDFVATQLFGWARDFDHLRATIEDRLPGLVAMATVAFGEDEGAAVARLGAIGQGLQLFVAGWSDREDGPAAFSISTAPRNGREPFEVHDAEAGFLTPALHEEDWEKAGGLENRPPASVENLALLTLELQRQKPEHGRYSVGGLVELVTIRKDRVECRILKRWDEDRIGEKISPSPVNWTRWRREHPVWDDRSASDARIVPFEPRLSRQQVRAMARRAS